MEAGYALDEARLAPLLAAKPKRGGVWEADVFESSSVVRDAEGAYVPLMTMIVEQETGFVFSTRMVGRAYRAVDALGDDIVEAATMHKKLPETLVLRTTELSTSLAPLAARLKVSLEGGGALTTLYNARRAMFGAQRRVKRRA